MLKQTSYSKAYSSCNYVLVVLELHYNFEERGDKTIIWRLEHKFGIRHYYDNRTTRVLANMYVYLNIVWTHQNLCIITHRCLSPGATQDIAAQTTRFDLELTAGQRKPWQSAASLISPDLAQRTRTGTAATPQSMIPVSNLTAILLHILYDMSSTNTRYCTVVERENAKDTPKGIPSPFSYVQIGTEEIERFRMSC